MKKIVTVGEILVEIMAVEPGEGFREPIPLVGPFPSGAPAIFIDQAARFGQPCGIVSCVGRDDFGRLNVDRLRNDGADVSAIAEDPARPTGSAFVRYRDDGSRDFIFNIRHSACASIALNEAARTLIAGADHLHVMGSSLFSDDVLGVIRFAADDLRRRGGTVSFDPNIRKELLDAPGMREALDFVLSRTDLFLPSGDELFLFSAAADERAAVAAMLERGVGAVVLKRGAGGASYFDAFQDIFAPAHPVDVVDATGAGDCFGATFVSCWLRGLPPSEALVLANAAGALAVGRTGPMEGNASRAEIDAFMAQRLPQAAVSTSSSAGPAPAQHRPS